MIDYAFLVVINFVLIFSNNISLTIILVFCIGFTASATCSVAYVFMIENIVPEWRSMAGTWFNVFCYTQSLFVALFLKFLSINMEYINYIGLLASILATILIWLLIEESPLFLLKKGNFGSAK